MENPIPTDATAPPVPVLVGDAAAELLQSVGWSARIEWRSLTLPIIFALSAPLLWGGLIFWFIEGIHAAHLNDRGRLVVGLLIVLFIVPVQIAIFFLPDLRRRYILMYKDAATITVQRLSTPQTPHTPDAGTVSALLRAGRIPVWYQRGVFAAGLALSLEASGLGLFILWGVLANLVNQGRVPLASCLTAFGLSCIAFLLLLGAKRLIAAAVALWKMESRTKRP